MIKYIYRFFLLFAFFNNFVYADSELYKSDLYYLDNNEVLLYKISNWWSTEAHKKSNKPCFKSIKVRSNDTIIIKYNKKLKVLKLYFNEDFADLLSIFKNKKDFLKNIYINKKYFKNAKVGNIKKINSIQFQNVNIKEYKNIKDIKKNIAFELEGRVAGLLNFSGKFALHKEGDFLRVCSSKKVIDFNITFKVIDIKTKEVLAKYISN